MFSRISPVNAGKLRDRSVGASELLQDPAHFQTEVRFFLLGQTDAGRLLFVAFTLRETLICIVSARDMSRKERRVDGTP